MFSGDGYLYGRAHGIIGKVLTRSQINFLLSSSNLKELQAAFRQTQYGPIVQDINFVTEMPEVAKQLKNHFSQTVSTFYKQGSSRAKKIIDLHSQRFHAENIRYILRGLFMKQPHEEIIERISPVGRYSYEYYEKVLSSSLSIADIIKSEKIQTFKQLLEQGYSEFQKTGRFVPVDAAIDQFEYYILPIISREFDVYVNLKNIIWVCRCINLGIAPYRYIKPTTFIAKALESNSIPEVLSMYNFGIYKRIFADYMGKDDSPLHDIEFAVERFQIKKWKKIFRQKSSTDLKILIAFFEMKYAEISDLIRIIVGINAGFSQEEIEKSFLFY